jgi:hypothetical protein
MPLTDRDHLSSHSASLAPSCGRDGYCGSGGEIQRPKKKPAPCSRQYPDTGHSPRHKNIIMSRRTGRSDPNLFQKKGASASSAVFCVRTADYARSPIFEIGSRAYAFVGTPQHSMTFDCGQLLSETHERLDLDLDQVRCEQRSTVRAAAALSTQGR